MSIDKNAIGNIDHVIAAAPLPTRSTLRRRFNPVWQLGRGAALMLRIMRMVLKGHSSH
ncbi:MAG TPA: hypothetical protein GXZ45_15295 [Propionibacterium sp.]|nr:hypothetical protein [Propionibacterium sp.]